MLITHQYGGCIRTSEHKIITLPQPHNWVPYFPKHEEHELYISTTRVNFGDASYPHLGPAEVTTQQDIDPDAHAAAWGVYDYCSRDRFSHSGINTILSQFLEIELVWVGDQISNVLNRYQVGISTDNPAQLAIWPDRAHYDQGDKKRRRGKPGKILRYVIPSLTDKQVETLVNKIRDKFMIDVSGLTHHIGTSREEFKHAYTHNQPIMAQVNTCGDRKLSADSCMRHNFDHLHAHPVEAYASGDFAIHWLEGPDNKIAARTIVHIASGTRAPVYGVSDPAIEKLINLTPPRSYGYEWVGARILKIPYNDYEVIAPYMDVSIGGFEETHDPNFLKMTRDEADWTTNGHEGTQNQGEVETCSCCDEIFPSHRITYVDDYGYVCDGCQESCFVSCDHDNSLVHEDTVETVETSSGSEEWGHNAVRRYATYIERLDEYWADDDVYHDKFGEPFTSRERDEGDWVMHEPSGEYYPADHEIFEEEEEVDA